MSASSTPVAPRPPVVVIGAGPVGLVAALLLARHGIACEIFERHSEPYPLPRAVHLDDEAVRILQAAGVAEEFLAHSRPALGMQLVDAHHRVMARFLRDRAIGASGFPQANMFDQPDLEVLLRGQSARQPLLRLHTGTEVSTVDLPHDGVSRPVVHVRDVATGRRRRVEAAAVLGCDGAGGLTHGLIGSRHRDLGQPQRWLVVDGRCPDPLPAWEGVHQVCDAAAPATYMRIGHDRYRWEFRLTDEAADTALADHGRLMALLTPWTGGTREVEVVRVAGYTFRARVADRWRQDRVFLLGDAAHLTPPFIGQGLGAGLRDAHNLAWKLSRVLRGSAPERLLDTYEPERIAHATRLVRTAVLIGHAMTSGNPVTAATRSLAARTTRHTEAFSKAALATVSPALAHGPLVTRRPGAGRGPRPGDLCPQPRVLTGEKGDALLDDVLGDGFSILTCRPLTPALRRLAQALPARVVSLEPAPTPPGDDTRHVVDPSGRLRAWLKEGAVLLRPDRVVLASQTGRDTDRDTIARSAARWAPYLTP